MIALIKLFQLISFFSAAAFLGSSSSEDKRFDFSFEECVASIFVKVIKSRLNFHFERSAPVLTFNYHKKYKSKFVNLLFVEAIESN